MNTTTFVKQIKELPGYRGQVVHVERLKARRARYGQLERPLPPALQATLRQAGADKLYRHQAQAINACPGRISSSLRFPGNYPKGLLLLTG